MCLCALNYSGILRLDETRARTQVKKPWIRKGEQEVRSQNQQHGRSITSSEPDPSSVGQSQWKAPPGLDDARVRLFETYARELHEIRGAVLPSDLEQLHHCVLAHAAAERARTLADVAAGQGDIDGVLKLGNAAGRETKLHQNLLMSLGLRGRERGVKRTADAAAQLASKSKSSRWDGLLDDDWGGLLD